MDIPIRFNAQEPGHLDSGPLFWAGIAKHLKTTRIQERKSINEYSKPFAEHATPPIPKKLTSTVLLQQINEQCHRR